MPDPPPTPIAFLEVGLDNQIQRFPLVQGQTCRIGRSTRNTIVLASSQVSRDHALIDCPDGNDCLVTDLGSLNGTHINGARISAPTALIDGDIIAIGEFRLSFIRTSASFEESTVTGQETAIRILSEQITVLVIDIRNFTVLSREVGAERLSELMSHFTRESGAHLRTQAVWTQKYIGDAIMSIWVHSAEAPATAVLRRALISACSIYQIAASLQTRFSLDKPVRIGAAINTGHASLGSLGSGTGADFTALGDTVNKAFRLEAATREVPCDLLLGEAAYDSLDSTLAEQCLPCTVRLKGYPDPEPAFALSMPQLIRTLNLSQRTLQL